MIRLGAPVKPLNLYRRYGPATQRAGTCRSGHALTGNTRPGTRAATARMNARSSSSIAESVTECPFASLRPCLVRSGGKPSGPGRCAFGAMVFTLGWMPGYPHFYPHNVASLAGDGTRMPLGDRVIEFLDEHLE